MSVFRSLRGRLALVYAALAAVMLIAVYAIAESTVERALYDSAAERLEIEAGLVVAGADGPRRATATDLAAGDLAQLLGGYGTAVAIIDGSGNVLAAEPNGAADKVLEARLGAADYAAVIASGETMQAVRPAADGTRTLIVAAPIELRTGGPPQSGGQGNGQGQGRGNGNANGNGPPGGDGGIPNAVAQLAISLDSIDATVAGVRATLQLITVALLVAAGVAVWLVMSYGLRPLGRVAAAADRIAAGDLTARVELAGGDDEVSRLSLAFDRMADGLDASRRAQDAFAADASHELRSPLTVLGGYVDVLGTTGEDPEARARTLATMRREIDRLSRLSADLLLLTQLEAGGGRLEPRQIDLRELVEDIAAAARVIGPDRSVVLTGDGPVPIVADPDRLTQAVMNLVDNAVRHTPPGETFRISTARSDGHAVVSIANPGAPIPEDELPHVFERFYRASSAPRQGAHAGLGLAIVKAIAEASGGSVSATSDTTETRISIHLPLASSAPA